MPDKKPEPIIEHTGCPIPACCSTFHAIIDRLPGPKTDERIAAIERRIADLEARQ